MRGGCVKIYQSMDGLNDKCDFVPLNFFYRFKPIGKSLLVKEEN